MQKLYDLMGADSYNGRCFFALGHIIMMTTKTKEVIIMEMGKEIRRLRNVRGLTQEVPADGEGQYFAVEEYYLKQPRRSELRRKFLEILLKLNCYYDFEVWPLNHNNCEKNPAPELLEEWMMKPKKC